MNVSSGNTATLAGGCFWCLEALFDQLQGIEGVESGYTGGSLPAPSYDQVCTGDTGHAEAVQITFDSEVISFGNLLEVFFSIHDPTTLDRQGPDVGSQYRSAIFYHNAEQQVVAEEMIAQQEKAGIWGGPIVTEVVPLSTFYLAEGYHQKYFQRNSNEAYCRIVISPKVGKFREQFLSRLRG